MGCAPCGKESITPFVKILFLLYFFTLLTFLLFIFIYRGMCFLFMGLIFIFFEPSLKMGDGCEYGPVGIHSHVCIHAGLVGP